MGFQHRAFEQESHRLQEVIDGESGYRIVVDNSGAELVSIARRTVNGEWDGYLYRDGEITPAERGWQNHATVMGYFLHRIKGERTYYEGDEIRGGNHGFLRHKRFVDPDVLLNDRATLCYSLPADQILRTEYPRKVSFRISYTVQGEFSMRFT